MDTSINAYYEEFDKALKKRRAFANFNNDTTHANIVICVGIRHATKHVRLLSQRLEPSLYSGEWFQEELSGFLERGGRLDVLIETAVSPEHPVMKLASQSEQVTVKRIPDEDQEKYKFNFMVVDDDGLRLENDREKIEATVVFYHDDDPIFRKVREQSIRWFDDRFNSIKQVAL